MKDPTLILLTGDSVLEASARAGAALAGFGIRVGRSPQEGARVFARSLDSVCGVVVDLDNCKSGTAWLTTMTSACRKIPGLAISSLNPRFLRPLAIRHGAEHWLSKPVSADEFCAAAKVLYSESRLFRDLQNLEPVVEEALGPLRMGSVSRLSSVEPGTLEATFSPGNAGCREFSAYWDSGNRCILKETGDATAHRMAEVSEAIDFILSLEIGRPSLLSVYTPDAMLFRILV